MFRLILQFSFAEFRMRDQGTFLGFFWTLLKPITLFIALYAVFQPSFSGRVTSFSTYLLTGIILWDFFSVASQSSSSILYRRQHFLLSSTAHPSVYPVGSVLSILYAHVIEALLAGFFFSCIGEDGIRFAIYLLVGLILTAPIAYGAGCILAVLSTVFLDTAFLWSLLLRIGFFLTPIFYPTDMLSTQMLSLMRWNPLFYTLSAARTGHDGIFESLIIGGVLAALGTYIFHKNRYRFAEVV